MYLPSRDQLGHPIMIPLVSCCHLLALRSKSVCLSVSEVWAFMYRPSGDQWGENMRSEPTTFDSRFVFRSRMKIPPALSCSAGGNAPKARESPSGDQLGSP